MAESAGEFGAIWRPSVYCSSRNNPFRSTLILAESRNSHIWV
jgi:hypothetical protein